MRRKLWTVLWTIVLVFTLCFGPAACGENGNSGNNGGTEQGGTQQGGTQQGGGQDGDTEEGEGDAGEEDTEDDDGGQDDGSSHTITVFLLANYNEGRAYDEYFEYMEDELAAEGLNYKISFRFEQEANYYAMLDSYFSNGRTPDIFYLRPNEILKYKTKIASLQSYADAQTDVDLSEIYPQALDMYRYNPATGELGNKGDDLYAFPKDISTQQLGYNKTLLEQFTPMIKAAWPDYVEPWNKDFSKGTYTWEQYKTICKAIADNANANQYASDVPSIEVLAHSFGGELIDFSDGRANGTVNSLTAGAVQQAIEYQAELVDCGAASYRGGTYSNFCAGRVCFYGLMGSWEVAEYDYHLGEGNWGVMPWPTVDGGTNWQGEIYSSGCAVSKDCVEDAKNPEKGDVAKRIAMSFMTSYAQNFLVKEKQVSLPLRMSMAEDYRDPANDSIYSPSTRGVFLDVVSGKNGYLPARYFTYDDMWLDTLITALEDFWNAGRGGALARYGSIDWTAVQQRMQKQYDAGKVS